MRISQVMSRRVQTVRPALPAWKAWELMRRRGIHHLVVMEHGDIEGVLSDADAGGPCGGNLRAGTTVGHLFSPHLTAVSPSASVFDVARLMQSLKLNCLVVLTRGKLVGIVTLADLAKVLASETTALSRRAREGRTSRAAHTVRRGGAPADVWR